MTPPASASALGGDPALAALMMMLTIVPQAPAQPQLAPALTEDRFVQQWHGTRLVPEGG